MEELCQLLKAVLNIDFIQAILSNPRSKEGILKVKVRPVEMKRKLLFQCESFTKTKAFHENLAAEAAVERLLEYMQEFKQAQISTREMDYTVLISKKGKVTIQKKKAKGCVKCADLSHNRSKRYILEEGIFVPFLHDLGVMTQDGKIVRTKFASSVRSIVFWNLSKISFRSWIKTEKSRYWILDVENLISRLPCIIICMS